MLRVDSLEVHYGSTRAVRGVSFELAEAGSLALLGANGAGKSSVLSALSRLVPSTGQVHLAGEDITRLPAERVTRAGLIHVPEGRRVFPSLSVHENLLMGLIARGSRSAEYAIDDVYDLFPPLRPLRRRSGYALSGGEAQMVAVGRGLLGAPNVMMVDEPSLGLSPLMTETVAEALITVSARTSLVVVEQNLQVATRICSDAIVLRAGEVVLRGSSADVLGSEDVVSSYLSA